MQSRVHEAGGSSIHEKDAHTLSEMPSPSDGRHDSIFASWGQSQWRISGILEIDAIDQYPEGQTFDLCNDYFLGSIRRLSAHAKRTLHFQMASQILRILIFAPMIFPHEKQSMKQVRCSCWDTIQSLRSHRRLLYWCMPLPSCYQTRPSDCTPKSPIDLSQLVSSSPGL